MLRSSLFSVGAFCGVSSAPIAQLMSLTIAFWSASAVARDQRGESFSDFCWSFVDGRPIVGDGTHWPATTPLAEEISKALKKRGFKFVGPTIVYAWMQAVGLVNDHALDCFRRMPCIELARSA